MDKMFDTDVPIVTCPVCSAERAYFSKLFRRDEYSYFFSIRCTVCGFSETVESYDSEDAECRMRALAKEYYPVYVTKNLMT